LAAQRERFAIAFGIVEAHTLGVVCLLSDQPGVEVAYRAVAVVAIGGWRADVLRILPEESCTALRAGDDGAVVVKTIDLSSIDHAAWSRRRIRDGGGTRHGLRYRAAVPPSTIL
jgi:hypothetical protein